MRSGTPMITRTATYTTRKAPPPWRSSNAGSLQAPPSPTTTPKLASSSEAAPDQADRDEERPKANGRPPEGTTTVDKHTSSRHLEMRIGLSRTDRSVPVYP